MGEQSFGVWTTKEILCYYDGSKERFASGGSYSNVQATLSSDGQITWNLTYCYGEADISDNKQDVSVNKENKIPNGGHHIEEM